MYHVAVNRVQQGPFNEAEIRQRIATGGIRAGDLCWQEGWPEWRKLGAVFPDAFGVPPQPQSPPPLGGMPPPVGFSAVVAPKTSGLAIASLVCGICTIVLFPLFFLFMIPAVVCGHVARSQIKEAKGAMAGAGLALAGLVMGYAGVALMPVGLLAAMAIPAFSKVRHNSLEQRMNNDARMIASAAQQYFLETGEKSVPFTYDQATGAVSGPLATWVPKIGNRYTFTPDRLSDGEPFQLGHPSLGPPRSYSAEGRRL